MSHRGKGNRGGAFPPRGRGSNYVSSVSSESNMTIQLSLAVSSATKATEVHHSNTNRGRGSRRRPNYRPPRGSLPSQSYAGPKHDQSHASSREGFQKPKHSGQYKGGGKSDKEPHAGRPNSHATVNKPPGGPAQMNISIQYDTGNDRTKKTQSLPVDRPAAGKTASSYRGRPRGGKGNPTHGGGKEMVRPAKYGGSANQHSNNKKKVDNMKRSVSCGICLEVWTRPKTLPCDHVFCEKCLEKIVIRNRQIVQCPECRQEHSLPPNGLRNSWFTHRYLESLADDFKSLKM